MAEIDKFEAHYGKSNPAEKLPWHHAEANRFIDSVHEARGGPARALDMGCGSGVDSVYLAKMGWRVISLDFAQAALDMTAQRATNAGVEVELVRADVTEWSNNSRFDLLLDSGLLHNMNRDKIAGYRKRILDWLQPQGDFVLVHWESRSDNDRLRRSARRASKQQLIDYFAPELTLHSFDRLEATNVPAHIGPDLSIGYYWFKRA